MLTRFWNVIPAPAAGTGPFFIPSSMNVLCVSVCTTASTNRHEPRPLGRYLYVSTVRYGTYIHMYTFLIAGGRECGNNGSTVTQQPTVTTGRLRYMIYVSDRFHHFYHLHLQTHTIILHIFSQPCLVLPKYRAYPSIQCLVHNIRRPTEPYHRKTTFV